MCTGILLENSINHLLKALNSTFLQKFRFHYSRSVKNRKLLWACTIFDQMRWNFGILYLFASCWAYTFYRKTSSSASPCLPSHLISRIHQGYIHIWAQVTAYCGGSKFSRPQGGQDGRGNTTYRKCSQTEDVAPSISSIFMPHIFPLNYLFVS